MKITILDHSENKGWYLAKGNMWEYLDGLKDNFYDFEVQRRIVANSYLDRIWESIKNGEKLPPISLSVSSIKETASDSAELDLKETEIIDGLQRTFRLWAIKYLWNLYKEIPGVSSTNLNSFISSSESGKKLLSCKILTPRVVRNLLSYENNPALLEQYREAFQKQDVYFYLWTDLSDEEIIRKMLILNAGQKRVSSTHQYEMLFLHCFKKGDFPKGVSILREKDGEFKRVKEKDRKPGEFLLVTIIVGLQSFIQKKPLKVPGVNDLDMDEVVPQEADGEFFSPENLKCFINVLYEKDKEWGKNGKELLRWMGKETTLSGICAALGATIPENLSSPQEKLQYFSKCYDKLKPDEVRLKDFTVAYDNLSSVRINVGNTVRKAIYNFFKSLLEESPISWKEAFCKG